MTHKLRNDHWKTLLPESYEWLKAGLQLQVASTSNKADVEVVGVTVDSQDANKVNVSEASLADAIKAAGWDAKTGSLNLVHADQQYLLVPTVQGASSDIQLARQWGMNVAKQLAPFHKESVALRIPASYQSLFVFEGFASHFYNTNRLRLVASPKHKLNLPKNVTLVTDEKVSDEQVKHCLALNRATTFTRFLQDAPANWMDTEQFGVIALEAFKDLGVKCKVLGEEELAAENMNLFLSVARGSTLPAQMIVVEVEGKDKSSTCALVGKGLTFDAGGISLKPSAAMGEMKYDMSGGAAVFGAMHYLAEVTPPTNVVGVIGCAENMPSAHATKPGDVIAARNRKTVEILNTDAEGRLVLADVLNYTATNYKPAMMINAATLTGACLHALGHHGGAVMTNDSQLGEYVAKVSRDIGEPFWQLPLWPDMEKEIKGDCSDLTNIAKPGVLAGTIIGGVFLREFVEKVKWAHLDIAGVAWSCKATGFPSSGGSGFAVRTMAECCLRYEG